LDLCGKIGEYSKMRKIIYIFTGLLALFRQKPLREEGKTGVNRETKENNNCVKDK